ncbi:MAG: N-6 DNA methylase [Acetobacteraceae bacterium]
MFLVDANRLGPDTTRLDRIRRIAAMRGDVPYLGVVGLGRLDVYRVALDGVSSEKARIDVVPKDEEAATFARLSNVRPGASPSSRGWIADVVLDLLDEALDTLRSQCGLTIEDSISLVGRALFARFLGDRNLLPEPLASRAANGTLFDSATLAREASNWLDETFNGDFLPLAVGTFERLPNDGFKVLGNISRRAPGGQFMLGWAERWDNLNFAHIPVGVLSQAYERYISKHDPTAQRRQGGYYTPRQIAELMVRAAFAPLAQESRAHRARVLDPATGAGVFLLTSFRRIVAERWRTDGVRPGTQTLREILYNQLTGFDIDESALRFAALGLYLLSIELDPDPEPVAKLGFENLRGTVLHRSDSAEGPSPRGLGSLHPNFHPELRGKFDLVIGNPPWTSGTKLPDWPIARANVESIARGRLKGNVPALLPNEALDLPFVWRAMEWALSGGQIAFALHARLLFQQGDGMPQARGALFRALDVTGVVNGAELRQTKVWPDVSAPFCLLFARNQVPGPEAAFRFVSPRLEPSLNNAGTMRIDATRANLVTPAQIVQRPEVMKILFRGGDYDLQLVERIESSTLMTIREYWTRRFGVDRARHLRFSGNGYQQLRNSSRLSQHGDGLPGQPADHLRGLPEITDGTLDKILIETDGLPLFHAERVHRGRARTIFQAPVLVVHKSPPAEKMRIQVGLAMSDVVFDQSYYGYSAKSHPDGARLLRFLSLVIGSMPALWLTLLTSGEFGFERDSIEKSTIDGILVPDFDVLSQEELNQIDVLFESLDSSNDEATWAQVDAWIAHLYGLQARDLQVIGDTLRFNLPFAVCRAAARNRPSDQQVTRFQKILEAELRPWGRRSERVVAVYRAPTAQASVWRGLQIRAGAATEGKPEQVAGDWRRLLQAADHLASTLTIYRDDDVQCLWVELLDQARYWSNTQARSLARQLAWDHVDFLSGSHKT